MHVVLEVLSTARVIERKAQIIFRAYGLTAAQFNVLNCLADQPHGMKASDLAQGLIVDPSNVTGMLRRMKKEGWLHEIENPKDLRQRVVTLSPKGLTTWKAAHSGYQSSLDLLSSGLTDRQRSTCVATLHVLSAAATRLGALSPDA
jgi:DNA-binding MarR family transcriptional regulator